MTATNTYSLEDLGRQTGIEPRTIRSYIAQGLLKGPDTVGPNASYSDYHLNRLKVIRLLRKARDLPLDKIRALLQGLTEEQIEGLAKNRLMIGGIVDTDDPPGSSPQKSPSSALEYVTSIPRRSSPGPGSRKLRAADTGSGPLPQLIEALKSLAADRVADTAGAKAWHEIEITPDIRLSVRGHYSDEQIQQFNQLASLLRHFLLKGVSNGQNQR